MTQIENDPKASDSPENQETGASDGSGGSNPQDTTGGDKVSSSKDEDVVSPEEISEDIETKDAAASGTPEVEIPGEPHVHGYQNPLVNGKPAAPINAAGDDKTKLNGENTNPMQDDKG